MSTHNSFQQSQAQYFRLKGQLMAGRITQQQFDAALKDLMIQDTQGHWWIIGADDGKWYVNDRTNWVQQEPEGAHTAEVVDTNDPYTLGFLAIEYLIPQSGDERVAFLRKFWAAQGGGLSWQDAFESTSFGMSAEGFYSKFEEYRRIHFPHYCGSVEGPVVPTSSAPFSLQFARQLLSGDMPVLEAPWSNSPNIPYVFCATGVQLPLLPGTAIKPPAGFAGWNKCGAGCLTIYMPLSATPGSYTLAIVLPDGRRLESTFQHVLSPPTATSRP